MKEESPRYLRLQNHHTDSLYLNGYAKLRDTRTIYREQRISIEYSENGCFIDIFPFENAFPLVILHDIPLNKHKFIIKMRCWQDFNSSNFGFYETMSFPRSDAGISGKRDCHTDLNQQVLKKSR